MDSRNTLQRSGSAEGLLKAETSDAWPRVNMLLEVFSACGGWVER
jgi:hypothetical protein